MRRSFIFYGSYYDAICDLPDEEQGRMYKFIVDYAMTGIEPKIISGQLKSYFKLIKPNIDAGIRRYENGLKGGAPMGNQNARKNDLETSKNQSKNNQNSTENQPKNNLKTSEIQPKNNQILSRYNQEQDFIIEQEREQNNEQEQDAHTTANDGALVEYWLEILISKTKQLNTANVLDNTITDRLCHIYTSIANKPECKVAKTILPNFKVLENFVNLFRANDKIVQKTMYEVFNVIDNKTDIGNKLNYTVGVLYNKANGF